MNRLAYLLSLICILAFSSCEEDKVYYHTAAKADFTMVRICTNWDRPLFLKMLPYPMKEAG